MRQNSNKWEFFFLITYDIIVFVFSTKAKELAEVKELWPSFAGLKGQEKLK